MAERVGNRDGCDPVPARLPRRLVRLDANPRVKVFHMAPYMPSVGQFVVAAIAIVVLIALAIGPVRQRLVISIRKLRPPHPWVLFLLSGLAVIVLFGLDLLAFGIMPTFPPLLAVAIGVALVGSLVAFVPRFWAHELWSVEHELGLLYGAIIFNMAVLFVAYQGAAPIDFYGKAIVDLIAVAFMVWFGLQLRKREASGASRVSGGPTRR